MLTAFQLPPYVGSRDTDAEAALENKRRAAIRYLTERGIGEYGDGNGSPLAVDTQGVHTQVVSDINGG